MPDVVKLALVALLGVALCRAYAGAPPARARLDQALLAATAGCAIYGAAIVVALAGHMAAATLLVAPGLLALAFAGWLSRGGEDGPGGDADPAPDGPIDWDEFDRARDEWSRTGPRVPTTL